MKFARYLEETQTPEWKKAYIDYRGLKKRITAIRRAHQVAAGSSLDEGSSPLLRLERTSTSDSSETTRRPPPRRSIHTSSTVPTLGNLPPPSHGVASETTRASQSHPERPSGVITALANEPDGLRSDPGHINGGELEHPPPVLRSTTEEAAPVRGRGRSGTVTGIIGRAFSTTNHPQRANSQKGSAGGEHGGPRFDLRRPIPLMELLPQLTPVERAFFDKLDEELDKVESFYCEREREMRHRGNLLKEQLQELQDHRRAFYEAHPIAATPYSWLPLPLSAPIIPNILIRRRKGRQGRPNSHKAGKAWKQPHSPSGHSDASDEPHVNDTDGVVEPEAAKAAVKQLESGSGEEEASKDGESSPETTLGRSRWRRNGAAKSVQALFQFRPTPINGPEGQKKGSDADDEADEAKRSAPGHDATLGVRYDPEEYQHAKKQLKKAVLECYRGLELLNNYRTLNLIGFRKALKKFEKVTHIPAQTAYTKEKIEPSAFSSGATVDSLIRDMEALFAARFARGDKKKALARLRGGTKHTSHHFSTFRTGMFLGLAIPALADGLYRSFDPDTRAAIPGWDGLMYIYAVFFIPTLFALLVGTNLLVWARARINYVFIFELDLRTRMDYRVYFEMPAFLLSLLCYAFWLSFARVGAGNVAPTTWPLLWLAFTALVMFNPLPVMFKPSRWWLIRNVSKLLTSGMHRVEFADFWMGDQFCSLVFTLSNLYFVGCIYATGIDDTWRRCTSNPGPRWGIAFLLASLPLLVRLVQSVKRWVDSRLITHLINGGKYGSGIIQYLFYFLWREQGGKRGPIFVVWCIFATNYSLYAGAWDLLMDWSLLRPHAPYPFLRPNLLYSNSIPFYYFAIITNILIRFIWVLYIPEDGPDFIIRTFIAGMLEALRRWQWNFLRLENEHLGNIDQYRVTREVPLPYSYDEPSHDSDGEDEEDTHEPTNRSWKHGRRGSASATTAADVDA